MHGRPDQPDRDRSNGNHNQQPPGVFRFHSSPSLLIGIAIGIAIGIESLPPYINWTSLMIRLKSQFRKFAPRRLIVMRDMKISKYSITWLMDVSIFSFSVITCFA